MAEITSSDFAKLVEAQKETTRQLMTAEERAADDAKKAEQFRVRSEAATRGHETRLANQNQNAAQRLADEGQDKQEESVGFLGQIANFMGMDRLRGAAEAEEADKQESRDSKMMGYLKSTAGFLGGIAKQGMEKVKSGLSGFKKFAFGALAVAALAFLNSPKFEEIKTKILDVVIPALAKLYDNVIKPLAIAIGEKLGKLFNDILLMIDGEKSILSVLGENKLAIAGIITALAPNLVFGALKTSVSLFVSGVKLLATSGIFAKISAGFAAVKTFMSATLLPAVKAFMVPLLPIIAIAAGVALAFYSLKKGFDDFMFELEATGSIWEAVKTGIISVISNLFGFPLNLIKSGVSFILEKIGSLFGIESFMNASKFLDEIDIVEEIKEGFSFIGKALGEMFSGLKKAVENILRSSAMKFLGGGVAADYLFGTKEEQAAEAEIMREELKREEEARKALKEKQRLDKEAAQAEKLAILKKKQEQIQPVISSKPILFTDTSEEDIANAQAKMARERRLRALRPTPEQELKQEMPNIFNAPTNVSAPATTNVTQMSKTLAPKDRVMDELGFAV